MHEQGADAILHTDAILTRTLAIPVETLGQRFENTELGHVIGAVACKFNIICAIQGQLSRDKFTGSQKHFQQNERYMIYLRMTHVYSCSSPLLAAQGQSLSCLVATAQRKWNSCLTKHRSNPKRYVVMLLRCCIDLNVQQSHE